MQDRYVGDAGDYAKFALLKALAGEADPLRLGVLWYLYPDEGHNGDGRHTSYLHDAVVALRDADLHAKLAVLVKKQRRSVGAVQRASILPTDTIFYSAPVTVPAAPVERRVYRARWFTNGLRRMRDAEIIFFDPDNGVETPALNLGSPKVGKYVFWSEIEAAWASGKSLVIYNHLNRSASAAIQTERLYAQFASRLSEPGAIVPLLFRRGSCRHLWVVAQTAHKDLLVSRVRSFMDRGWATDTQAGLISTALNQT